MNPFDNPIPPLKEDVLAQITKRSADGEGVVNIIRDMKLDILNTLERLRRYHVDEIVTAKHAQKEALAAKADNAKPV